jgi:ribonuclease Y
MDIITIIVGLIGLAIGGAFAYVITRKNNQTIIAAAEEKANAIIKEGESKAELYLKDKTMEAKERFYQLKTEHEKHITEKDKNIVAAENRIKQKEATINQQLEQTKRKETEVETIQQNLSGQLEIINRRKEELEKAHQKQVQALEKIAGLSAEDANET